MILPMTVRNAISGMLFALILTQLLLVGGDENGGAVVIEFALSPDAVAAAGCNVFVQSQVAKLLADVDGAVASAAGAWDRADVSSLLRQERRFAVVVPPPAGARADSVGAGPE